MIVVESGGTKSTWVFETEEGTVASFATVGLHPREISSEKEQVLKEEIKKHSFLDKEIHFYGAGCESSEAKDSIKQFLNRLGFVVKRVETDIHAACVAHLGNQSGVVGILGTGAVAAQFDGEKVTKLTSGWGYILGDEGSGFDLGKRLIQTYLRGELPEKVKEEVDKYFDYGPIIHRVYAPDGRRFVAGLTKIIAVYKNEAVIAQLINDAFTDFCKTALIDLDINKEIHFVGSIAYYFQGELRKVFNEHDYQLGNIHTEAIHELFTFLKSKKR